MKTVAIIQARMGSTRLPGKVLKEVLSRPLLSYQIERMKQIKLIDEIVIATTNDNNNEIIDLCVRENVQYFLGSEFDVLARYYEAAKAFNATHIVRMTSDCPVIDPVVVDDIISLYFSGKYDYVSNTIERTFPRGLDAEIFSFNMLETAFYEAELVYEREHVTPFMYLNPFNIAQYTQAINLGDIRLTVDTPEDFELISLIYKKLYEKNPNFRLSHMMELFERDPKLLSINNHIIQKKLGE